MRFKTVYLLAVAVLFMCVSPSLGKKPEKPKPVEPYDLLAGFDCTTGSQAVCTEGPLNTFDRASLLDFHASYVSHDTIWLQSELGDPDHNFVRNDPDDICGLLGEEFTADIDPGNFDFWGNSNTNEAAVSWKFFDLSLGSVTLPKVTFFYRDENFTNYSPEGDPFAGIAATIENSAVLARIEGYVPEGAKRGKNIQCLWPVYASFTVDDD